MSLTKSVSNMSKSIKTPSLPKSITQSIKMPSMPKSFSGKMPSMPKSLSGKMPSMPKSLSGKMPSIRKEGFIYDIFSNIFKNIFTIIVFILLLVLLIIIIQAFKIDFNKSSDESYEETVYVLKKNIKEGHGNPDLRSRPGGSTGVKLHPHTGNLRDYCQGGCAKFAYHPTDGSTVCAGPDVKEKIVKKKCENDETKTTEKACNDSDISGSNWTAIKTCKDDGTECNDDKEEKCVFACLEEKHHNLIIDTKNDYSGLMTKENCESNGRNVWVKRQNYIDGGYCIDKTGGNTTSKLNKHYCCSTLMIGEKGEDLRPGDWGTNHTWQNKPIKDGGGYEWYCHCYLGVPANERCCNSVQWGVNNGSVVKPKNSYSDCLPENANAPDYYNPDFSDFGNEFSCLMQGKKYNKETGDCDSWGGGKKRKCKKNDHCRNPKYGFVPLPMPKKECRNGKCVCPVGEDTSDHNEQCERIDSSSSDPCKDGGGNDNCQSYMRHKYGGQEGSNAQHRYDKVKKWPYDTGGRTGHAPLMGVVNPTTNKVLTKEGPQDIKTRDHTRYTHGSSHLSKEGFESTLSDASCNMYEGDNNKFQKCQDWWNTAKSCKNYGPEFCKKMSVLGEEHCLKYPCCLWEYKKHEKSPKWVSYEEECGNNCPELDGKASWQNKIDKDYTSWFEDKSWNDRSVRFGRCVKGTPHGGPHDKSKWKTLIQQKNAENLQERENRIAKAKASMDPDKQDNDDNYIYWKNGIKNPTQTVPEPEKDTEKYNKDEKDAIDEELGKDPKIDPVDQYYYTEYKHRRGGGIGHELNTSFYRFFDNSSKEVFFKDGDDDEMGEGRKVCNNDISMNCINTYNIHKKEEDWKSEKLTDTTYGFPSKTDIEKISYNLFPPEVEKE